MVVPESGGGGFWRGRRSQCPSVHLCCMILFCRTILLTGVGGFLTLFMATPLRVLTLISRRRVSLQSVGCLSICGRSKFRLRYLFLLGVFSATESQLKTTFSVGASFLLTTLLVLVGAVLHHGSFTHSL